MAPAKAQPKKVNAVFRALSNERRRQIIEMVRTRPRSAWEIAKAFDCTWPAISRHLRILRMTGIVSIVGDLEETTRPVFVVETDTLALASKWLDEVGPD